MKIVLTADLHLRPESADVVFGVLLQLVVIAKREGAKGIAILGDLWHVRYAVPVELLNRFHAWTGLLEREGLSLILLAGNHDQVDVSGQNALQVFERPHVIVVSQPQQIGSGAWLPYDRDVKRLGERARALAARGATVAFVHQGIVGAVMNNGVVAGEADGLGAHALSGFKHAFFGHWHRHQTIGNATYCGSPWQTRADEAGQVKGCIVLDHETLAWKFVEIDIGQRHLRVENAEGIAFALQTMRKGDIVRVDGAAADAAQELRDAATERGVTVVVDAEVDSFKPRLGIDSSQPLRVHAIRFIEATEPDSSRWPALLAVFDETMGKVGA